MIPLIETFCFNERSEQAIDFFQKETMSQSSIPQLITSPAQIIQQISDSNQASAPTFVTDLQRASNKQFYTIKSSLQAFDEEIAQQKFITYSKIVIDAFTIEQDEITVPKMTEMARQLCSLSEYCWRDEFKAGQLRKMAVKQQLQYVLQNSKNTIALKACDVFMDDLIERVVRDNTRQQLLQLARQILKLTVKVTGEGGCFGSCL